MMMMYSQSGIIPKGFENDGTLEAGVPVSILSGKYTKFTATNKNYVGIAVDESIASPDGVQGIQQAKCDVVALGFVTAKVKETVTQGAKITAVEGGIKPATDEANAIGITLEAGDANDYVLVILDNVKPKIV